MTERTPPAWLQAGTYPAEDDRRLLASIFSDSEGIILPTDMAVTQRGAGANMSVDVAGGRAVIKGDLATYEGSYFMENRGVTNLTIAAADPTNPRIDRVIAEVLNAEYSGVSNLWRLRVVTGTPAGSPSAPALPTNAISLATVAVAALASSITNANITNLRTQAWIGTGTVVCTSTTRPATPYEGMEIYQTDTDSTFIYNGSTWVEMGRLGAWTDYTPTLTQSVTVTKTVTYAKYLKLGRTVHVSAILTVTGSGTPSQAIAVGLPVTAAFAGAPFGSGRISDGGANSTGYAELSSTTTVGLILHAAGNAYAGATSSGYTNGLGLGDVVSIVGTYEAAS